MAKSTLSPEALDYWDSLRFRRPEADRAQPSEIGEVMGLLLCLTYATQVEEYNG